MHNTYQQVTQSYAMSLTLEPPSSASFTSVASQIETVPRSSRDATLCVRYGSRSNSEHTDGVSRGLQEGTFLGGLSRVCFYVLGSFVGETVEGGG